VKRPAKDPIREERIHEEAIVDAYGSEEKAMSWYYYLEGTLSFPFQAFAPSVESRRLSERERRWRSDAWLPKTLASTTYWCESAGKAEIWRFRSHN
jgi:hypothetical protein